MFYKSIAIQIDLEVKSIGTASVFLQSKITKQLLHFQLESCGMNCLFYSNNN